MTRSTREVTNFAVLAFLLASCGRPAETSLPTSTRMPDAAPVPTDTQPPTATTTPTTALTFTPSATLPPSRTPTPTDTPLPTDTYEMTLYDLPGYVARFSMPPSEWEWRDESDAYFGDGAATDRFVSVQVENCDIVMAYKQILEIPVGGTATEVPEDEIASVYGEGLALGSHYFYWRSMSNETDVMLVYLLAAAQGELTSLEFVALAPQATWETECKPLVRAVLAEVEIVPE